MGSIALGNCLRLDHDRDLRRVGRARYIRSVAEKEPQDTIYHYLPPAVGCAIANYVGNHGQGPLSAAIVVAVLVCNVVLVLKPFGINLIKRD